MPGSIHEAIEQRDRRLAATADMIRSVMKTYGNRAVVRMDDDRETEMDARELALVAIIHGRTVSVKNPQQSTEVKRISGAALILQKHSDEQGKPGQFVILPKHGFTSPGGSTLILSIDEARSVFPEDLYHDVRLCIRRNLERQRNRVTFPKQAVVFQQT